MTVIREAFINGVSTRRIERLAEGPHKEKPRFAERLKQIWVQPDERSAKRMAALVCEEYEKRFPEAIHYLEEGLEDSLPHWSTALSSKRARVLTEGVYGGLHFANKI